ncbi:MAG: hypothetical protein K8F91_13875, partial [Candidatus Obscuribacterales bacterium]|nr:hypothetical protein [Candidatus Obscuribacterales bacterium]
IESIEIVELGGKKVIVMTGVIKETGTREKTIYVSLSGDWKETYEFGIGGSPDKEVFKKQLVKFDAALKTIEWKPAGGR